jgi:hypothetical protein
MDSAKKENSPESLPDGLSLTDAIARCGELQMQPDEIARLLARRTGAAQLLSDLATPGTASYEAYRRGQAEGILKLNIDLEANVSNPKAKDAYKSLAEERYRQAVGRKIDELFGEG